MKSNLDRFDTSNYPEDNVFDLPRVNSTVVLKLKDECAGVPIDEFVALGAKQYAFKTSDGKTEKKSRGVKRSVIKRKITFEDYKNSLLRGEFQHREQSTIQSKNHNLYTIKRRKISLNPTDDKRLLLANHCTLPLGYVDLSLQEEGNHSRDTVFNFSAS